MHSVVPEQVGLSTARLARIGAASRRLVEEGQLAGVVTLVARRGHIAHLEAVGLAEREGERPMSSDAIFRMYSMTKPVTCAAVLMLYEEGHFLLDDPVSRFIPGFKDVQVLMGQSAAGPQLAPLEGPMTIRHLLTHTAGLSYGGNAQDPLDALYQAIAPREAGSLAQMVAKLVTLPLAYQPGRGWRYSLANDVLGYLVQVVAGQPFEDFLAERLLQPLGMVDAHFTVPEDKRARVAAVYSATATGTLQRNSVSNVKVGSPHPSGGGGLFATVTDYVRFAQMLLNGGTLDGVRLLSRKTVELMTTNHLPASLLPFVPPTWPFRTGYGMGLGVRVVVNQAETGELGSVGSYTWGGAAGTDFWVDPREELIGLFLQQTLPHPSHPFQQFRVLAYQAIAD